MRRQDVAKFLARAELFQKVLHVQGSIVECGVYDGDGLMTWANLSAIFEPANHPRRVIGFDTFEGFPSLDAADGGAESPAAHEGGMSGLSYERILEKIARFDADRHVGHIPKVELVKGDASRTIPQYIEDNPHLVVALLNLDFDVHAPTATALALFRTRMPRGAVIVFDELNMADWPGETIALHETLGIDSLELRRFPFTSTLSYAVL